MKRTAREQRKERAEANKAFAAKRRADIAKVEEIRSEAVNRSLVKSKQRWANYFNGNAFHSDVAKHGSKLLRHSDYKKLLDEMEKVQEAFIRPVEDWKPKGKGCETMFRSLCEHLFAKYPMPAFLWSGLDSPHKALILDIAKGVSLYSRCKDGTFPVPLTRAMVHQLMTDTPASMSFVRAVRRVQCKAVGGSQRLFNVWAMQRPLMNIGTKEDETFWFSVLEWFAKQAMFDPAHIAPLVDYIIYRRNGDREFSMKGRTIAAMMRGMQEWHGELAKVQGSGLTYRPSGFKSFEMDRSHRDKHGNYLPVVWRINEILTQSGLVAEGKALHHCVASYSHTIEKGNTSIWSITCESFDGKQRVCTVEVLNHSRSIVQARGLLNRPIEAEPYKVMQQWANENALEINIGRYW